MTYSQYALSLVRTIVSLHKKIKYDVFIMPSETYIHRARAFIVETFLRNKEFTHLFFIDADMEWTPDAFMKVLNCQEDFCGANYPKKNKYEQWAATGGTPRDDGLIESAMLPLGFCKIARQVFMRIAEKTKDKCRLFDEEITDYFSHIKLENNIILGEDNSFCFRWKAAGGKCWIVPDCDIKHIGFYPFAGNYAQFLKEKTQKQEVMA